MKNLLIQMALLIILSFTACNPPVIDESSSDKQNANPLTGAWLLINGKYFTADRDSILFEVNKPDQPVQIKVFSEDYFAYISRREDGSNSAGSAGPYKIDENKYIETHDWSSYEIAIGATSTYEFRIKGDTLYMSGPIKSVYSNGENWDDHIQMDEIRIRANK
jgi:hypothetical protein